MYNIQKFLFNVRVIFCLCYIAILSPGKPTASASQAAGTIGINNHVWIKRLVFLKINFLKVGFIMLLCCPEICNVDQTGLEVREILLPLFPKCCD